jgi:hypothetical protein
MSTAAPDTVQNIEHAARRMAPDGDAQAFAQEWIEEEDSHVFFLGFTNYPTAQAAVFAVEAVRLLNAGNEHNADALRLLRMAVEDVGKITPPYWHGPDGPTKTFPREVAS